MNKRALESLVKCGGLDSTGASRRGMLDVPRAGARVGAEAAVRQAARPGLDLRPRRARGRRRGAAPPSDDPRGDEFEKNDLLKLEKETLGLYVSDHPLTPIRDQLRRKTDCTINEIERRRDGEIVIVGGIVSSLKQMTTKKGDPMVFAGLEDVTGSCEVVAFNSVYAHARDLLVQDRVIIVKGRIDQKGAGGDEARRDRGHRRSRRRPSGRRCG